MLGEAVALRRNEANKSIETWGKAQEVLEGLDLDPDEIKASRETNDELLDFVQ